MEVDVSLGGNAADLLDRLQNPSLIVGHHDRDELRVGTQRPLQLGRIDESLAIDRQVCNLRPTLLEALARVQHCMMFNLGSNHVIAGMGQSKNCKIVSFGAAAGEDHLCSTTSQQARDRLPRPLHRCARMLSVVVNRRGIPELVKIIRAHRLKHLRQERCGGVAVQIHTAHSSIVGDGSSYCGITMRPLRCGASA